MKFMILLIIVVIIYFILRFIFDVNIKKLKQISLINVPQRSITISS